jgi:acyl carrier protein
MTEHAERIPRPVMPTDADVAERIQALFVRVLNTRVASVDEDIIESGQLDSLGLIELLSELEHEFGITVDLAQLETDDFRSISSISNLVARAGGTARD